MRTLQYFLHLFIVKPFLRLYLRRDRIARHDGFKLLVRKGVFHPSFFFSTRIMYDFLKSLDLKGKSVLEVGSGAGLLSLLALRKGAKVTALDIDPAAVDSTRKNIKSNFPAADAHVIESDLFRSLKDERFDYIVINPPYYFKDAVHESQRAWYCGSNGEYFARLFEGLCRFLKPEGHAYLILEERCEIERIRSIASARQVETQLVATRQLRWETSFIYSLHPVAT
jgi:release factor glutamine methyltransferase